MSEKPTYEEMEQKVRELEDKLLDRMEAEKSLRHCLDEQEALQLSKIEMAERVLHDIGNAMTGLSTTVTKMLGEEKWQENIELTKLEQMVHQKQEAFSAALGLGKEKALIIFIRELKRSLEDRRYQFHQDCHAMAKAVSHINEILHLQRRYASEALLGQHTLLDLGELIEDALAIHSGGLKKRGVIVGHKIPAEMILVSGERTKLMQMFLHLFKNVCEAFDESEKGGDRIFDVTIEPLEQDKVRITLSDNATGFEQDQGESLFEPGFSTKRRRSGMGLTQSRSVIESHEGTIRLESSGKNQGAQAIIELPTANNEE